MNGIKDNTNRQECLYRGLRCLYHTAGSSFWTPPYTRAVKHTDSKSGYSNIVTLCYLLLASFVCMDHLETPFCACLFGRDALKGGRSTNSKCTSGLTRRKGFLKHKMNRWCETGILSTRESEKKNQLLSVSKQRAALQMELGLSDGH